VTRDTVCDVTLPFRVLYLAITSFKRPAAAEDYMDSPTPKTYDVVGLGVSTLDLLMVVDELPGSELVQRAHDSLLQGGGPIATALVALSRLGCSTAMIDKLGDDWRGKLIREEFERERVATDYLILAAGQTTSIASVLVRKLDGARTIIYAPGDAGEVVPSDIAEDLISSAKILHLNGRHPDACLSSARIAKKHGVLVSFDGGAHRFTDQLRPLIGLTDLCIVARQFAFAFSGSADIQTSAAKLLQSGPSIVVITAGTEGSWIFDQGGDCFHQPAYQLSESVDTTGAGDAYHGAFLYGLIQDYSLRKCGQFASAVASLNTRKLGGRTGLPSLEEAMKFLNEDR